VDARIEALDLASELDAILARHLDIGDHHVRSESLEDIQCRAAIHSLRDNPEGRLVVDKPPDVSLGEFIASTVRQYILRA
jgi:hypothetical protein